jgi:hypothetical protein
MALLILVIVVGCGAEPAPVPTATPNDTAPTNESSPPTALNPANGTWIVTEPPITDLPSASLTSTEIFFLIDESVSVLTVCGSGVPPVVNFQNSIPAFFLSLSSKLAEGSDNYPLKLGVATFDFESDLVKLSSANQLPTNWYEKVANWVPRSGIGDQYAASLLNLKSKFSPNTKRKVVVLLTDGTYGDGVEDRIEDALVDLLNEVEVRVVFLCPDYLNKNLPGQKAFWENQQGKLIERVYSARLDDNKWLQDLSTDIIGEFLDQISGQGGWIDNDTQIKVPGHMWDAQVGVVSLLEPSNSSPSFQLQSDLPTNNNANSFLQDEILQNYWQWAQRGLTTKFGCEEHSWTIKNTDKSLASFWFYYARPPKINYTLALMNKGETDPLSNPAILHGDNDLTTVVVATSSGSEIGPGTFPDFAGCFVPRVFIPIAGVWGELSNDGYSQIEPEMRWRVSLPVRDKQTLAAELWLASRNDGQIIKAGSIEQIQVEFRPALQVATILWNCPDQPPENACNGEDSLSNDTANFSFTFEFRGELPPPTYYFRPKNNEQALAASCIREPISFIQDDALEFATSEPAPESDSTSYIFSFDLGRKIKPPPNLYNSILNCGGIEVRWEREDWPVYTCNWSTNLKSGVKSLLECTL